MKDNFAAITLLSSFLIMLSPAYAIAAQDDAAKLNNAAIVYRHMGKFDKSIESYNKALSEAADKKLKAEILLGLSSSYLEKGIAPFSKNKDDSFYKKSIEYANECLKIMPDQWQALGNIGTIYMNMCDHEKADFYFKKSVKNADKNSRFYNQLLEQNRMNLAEMKGHPREMAK